MKYKIGEKVIFTNAHGIKVNACINKCYTDNLGYNIYDIIDTDTMQFISHIDEFRLSYKEVSNEELKKKLDVLEDMVVDLKNKMENKKVDKTELFYCKGDAKRREYFSIVRTGLNSYNMTRLAKYEKSYNIRIDKLNKTEYANFKDMLSTIKAQAITKESFYKQYNEFLEYIRISK